MQTTLNSKQLAAQTAKIVRLQNKMYNDDNDTHTVNTLLKMLAKLMQINANFGNVAIVVNDACYNKKACFVNNVVLTTLQHACITEDVSSAMLNLHNTSAQACNILLQDSDITANKLTITQFIDVCAINNLLQNCNTAANTLTVAQLHAQLTQINNKKLCLFANLLQPYAAFVYSYFNFAVITNNNTEQLVVMLQQETEEDYVIKQ